MTFGFKINTFFFSKNPQTVHKMLLSIVFSLGSFNLLFFKLVKIKEIIDHFTYLLIFCFEKSMTSTFLKGYALYFNFNLTTALHPGG